MEQEVSNPKKFKKIKNSPKLSFSIRMKDTGSIDITTVKGPNSKVTIKDIDEFVDTAVKQLEESRSQWKELYNKRSN